MKDPKKFNLDDFTFDDVEHELQQIEKKKNANIDQELIRDYGSLSARADSPHFLHVSYNGKDRYELASFKTGTTIVIKKILFSIEELDVITYKASFFDFSSVGNNCCRTAMLNGLPTKIYENICHVSKTKSQGDIWIKDINIINSGNGSKVDIRSWTKDYSQYSKGFTITLSEFQNLLGLMEDVLDEREE